MTLPSSSRQSPAWVFAAVGAATLVAEVGWVRALGAIVGSDAIAAQAVLAAFFAGSAVGLAAISARGTNATPNRALAWLSVGAAAAVLLSRAALIAARTVVPRLPSGESGIGHGLVAFAAALVVCGPATALVSAMLPAGARPDQPDAASTRRALTRFGFASAAGALLGALGCSFVGVGWLGASGALDLAAVLLIVAAAGARSRGRDAAHARASHGATAARVPHPRGILLALGLAGFAAIAFELAALRVIGPVSASTIYGFGAVVAAHILGATAGNALASRRPISARGVGGLVPWFSAAAFLVAACGWGLTSATGLQTSLQHAFGRGWFAEMGADFGTALPWVAPPAAFASMLFALGASLGARDARDLTPAALASAAGATLAPIVGGLLLARWWGTRGLVIAATTAFAAAGVALGGGRRARQSALAAALVAVVVALALPSPLATWPLPVGQRVVLAQEGADGLVLVEEGNGLRRLRTSSHYYEGGEESAFGERRQGLLPMLIARDPHRVLVMGLGAGVTLGAVADYPGAEVHGVELMAEVLAALPLFSRANGDVASRANVILHQADARTLVSRLRTNGAAFDVVIGDLFHPERESSALMYTHEHFAAVRRLLAPGGLFVQWLPLHELPPAALATVIATFLDSFPAAAGWLAYFNVQTPAFGLVGSEAPIQVSVGDLEARIAAPALREALATTLLDKPMEVLGGYVTDRSGLLRLAGSAPPATDDRPLVDVLVARELPIAPPFASLQAVLAARTSADSLLRGAARPGDVNRVDAFREAVADSLLGQAHTARGEWRAAAVLFRAGALRAPEFALNRILLERVAASLRRVGDARGADDVLRGLAAPSPRPDP